jgi:hypothetical protein
VNNTNLWMLWECRVDCVARQGRFELIQILSMDIPFIPNISFFVMAMCMGCDAQLQFVESIAKGVKRDVDDSEEIYGFHATSTPITSPLGLIPPAHQCTQSVGAQPRCTGGHAHPALAAASRTGSASRTGCKERGTRLRCTGCKT